MELGVFVVLGCLTSSNVGNNVKELKYYNSKSGSVHKVFININTTAVHSLQVHHFSA
jgi:hypothetical protein